MKGVVAAFNQEKALVGAFTGDCEIFGNLRIIFVSCSSRFPGTDAGAGHGEQKPAAILGKSVQNIA